MTPHDEFTRTIVRTLEQGAEQHPDKGVVLTHVIQAIKPRHAANRRTWAMGGFALAAAITGIGLAPSLLSQQPSIQPNQIAESAKMSPQMIEDLEMLSLLGMENDNYGS